MRTIIWISLIVLAILIVLSVSCTSSTPTTSSELIDRTIAGRLTAVDDNGKYSILHFDNSIEVSVSDSSITAWNKYVTGSVHYKVNSAGIQENVSMTYNFHWAGTFYDLVSVTP